MVARAEVAPAAEPPRIAFAVGRTVGGAVQRNRVRRRLRAAVRTHGAAFEPGHAYLVSATPRALHTPFDELSAALGGAVRAFSEDSR